MAVASTAIARVLQPSGGPAQSCRCLSSFSSQCAAVPSDFRFRRSYQYGRKSRPAELTEGGERLHRLSAESSAFIKRSRLVCLFSLFLPHSSTLEVVQQATGKDLSPLEPARLTRTHGRRHRPRHGRGTRGTCSPRLASLRAFALPPEVFGKVDSATYVQFLAARARSALQDPHCEMAKATRDGKIVGFVRWITPKDADTHAEQKAGNATSIWSQDGHYPPGSEVNLARELLEVHEKEILEPHFREASISPASRCLFGILALICLLLTGIGLLAVDPEAQGARVGSALLRHVCRQADEQGVAVYLRASPGT